MTDGGRYQVSEGDGIAAVVYLTRGGWVVECECHDAETARKVADRMNAQARAAAIAAHQREAERRAAAVLGRGVRRAQGARWIEPDIFA